MCFETFDNIINCIKDRFNQTDYQAYVHPQEIVKVFKEEDWKDDLQIAIQNCGVNEFDVTSSKVQVLFLPETAKFCGLDSRMQLLGMIALFQKLDSIRSNKTGKVDFNNASPKLSVRDHFRFLKELNLSSLNNNK